MISLNRTIAYTKKWKHTFLIALLLGVLIPVLLITLEPFDNSNTFSFKYLILSGYALCIIIPLVLIHPIENYVYKIQTNRWFVINETLYITVTLFLICLFSFFYHFYAISGLTSFTAEAIWGFIKSFVVPFIPIVVPLWLYLRSKYGLIEVPLYSKGNITKTVTIVGNNKAETLTIFESDFIFAKAQQNYVDVYFKSKNGIQQQTFRNTLSNTMKQLPEAWQVHRSYLVNLDYLKTVEGNARKRFIRISETEETIPISQLYYKALNKRLSISSQELQN
ncbi:LytTR family transcriptional regulator [Maribacter polysiphoniae]|uniref:LytTR family transcriptional regulator n=1 Tax=Maribacter polysiphoniae TaxID=429344 RepID=A0A316E5Y7_9FLAO|nr:LytTR family DNA-binding domain-containing protein [Maribacter polysiphoniae]MBD1262416.1 LytTR family transcriptional regulator [Maribacter polysiphoniae]PWK26117.1 LytTR family transcriptional regulator [Maribacter polysiphoniae]